MTEHREPTQDEVAAVVGAAGGIDSLGLLNLVLNQLERNKREILERFAEIEDGRRRRWNRHVDEHRVLDDRVGRIRSDLDKHLEEEQEDDLVWEARWGPARKALVWLIANWKIMFVILLSIAAFIDQIRDTITVIISGH